MNKELKIKVPEEKVTNFCKKYHIKKLSLFGSVLRDDFKDDSDVDVLVEFETGKTPGLLGMAHIEREISRILGGRKADLRTPQELSRYFRDAVVSNARVQYARG